MSITQSQFHSNTSLPDPSTISGSAGTHPSIPHPPNTSGSADTHTPPSLVHPGMQAQNSKGVLANIPLR